MSINKTLLKNDINSCFINFKEYFYLVYKLNNRVLDFWENLSEGNIYLEIKELEIKSNDIFKVLSGEISWNISKHFPEATNLRFFLAVLISLKDLERYADYGLSIAKIIKKHGKELKILLSDFKPFKEMLRYSEHIWNLIIDSQGKIKEEEFKSGLGLKNDFRNINYECSQQMCLSSRKFMSDKLRDPLLTNEDYLIFSYVHIVLTKIDRSFDHVFNILENFYQIYYPNSENDIISKEI